MCNVKYHFRGFNDLDTQMINVKVIQIGEIVHLKEERHARQIKNDNKQAIVQQFVDKNMTSSKIYYKNWVNATTNDIKSGNFTAVPTHTYKNETRTI